MTASLSTSKHRFGVRFSLRGLLLAVLLFGCLLVPLVARLHEASRQKLVVEAISKAGGSVIYDYEFYENSFWRKRNVRVPAPQWARRVLGDDFFRRVVSVSFLSDDTTEADLLHLAGLKNVRRLFILRCQITDVGLEHIGVLMQLENLYIHHATVTETGAASLRNLTRLNYLRLGSATDTELEYMTDLTNLKELDLRDSWVSKEGVARLQKALPTCKVIHESTVTSSR